MNACCNGCSRPSSVRPSTVVTSRPSYWTASAKQEMIRSPSTSTVQAPHAPWLHPFFVPYSSSCSRSKSSSDTRASVGTGTSRPLTMIDTADPPSATSSWTTAQPTPPEPAPFRPDRRARSYAGVMSRYGKREDLIVHESEPFNAETGLGSLSQPVTDTDAFYVRGHGTIPELDRGSWRLQVGGLVKRELSLSFETLREAFREQTETATLQCAGNRRAGLVAVRDIPGEAPWGPGATGTATWTGVALADVLALAGPLHESPDVGFEGAGVSPEG